MAEVAAAALLAALAATACAEPPRCGPPGGVVRRVLDGDTIALADGELVRYLLVDAPEVTGDPACFGAEAARANAALVVARAVTLTYDEECRDAYGRLLAYVAVEGVEINRALVERGYARVRQIPPNGVSRRDEYRALEATARAAGLGLWGACPGAGDR
ncbi:MAG: thermonuclease family protein [Kofleriaceae bacterium]